MNCQTDWASTGAMMQGLAALVAAAAAVVTALYGSRALSAWRGEVVGKRKVELAEDILAAAYEASEVIKGARSPMAFSGEGASLNVAPEVDDAQRRNAEAMYAPAERLNARPDLWAKIDALRFRARAYFGDEVWAAMAEILKVRLEVHNASILLARDALRQPAQRVSHDLRTRHEAKIWYAEEPDEPLQARVDVAIASLQVECGPAISDQAWHASAQRRGKNRRSKRNAKSA